MAAGDRRRHRVARGAGRGRHRLHDPRAAPGDARGGLGETEWQEAPSRRRRPDDALQRGAAVGADDRGLLLRRPGLARGRVRATALDGRAFRRAAAPAPSPRARRGRSWCTSPPTARPTATTTATATWRSPTRSTRSSPRTWRSSRTTASSWASSRRPTRCEIARTPRGAARTASSAGAPTAAATRRSRAGWNQAWRAPLRDALDGCATTLAPLSRRRRGRLFPDPWAARDAYVEVVLDRSPETVRPISRGAGRARARGPGAGRGAQAAGDAAPRAC